MLIDSHAHLNFEGFDQSWRQVAQDCLANDVWVINIGAQLATSKKAVEIAESFPQGIFAAVGLHPLHVLGGQFHPEEFNVDDYQRLIDSSKRVVALGETGIDFYHLDSNFEKQKEVFLQHIDLARKNDLALIVHARNSKDGSKNAYQEILQVIKQYRDKEIRGVIHCFGGSLEEAKKFLELGFYVGFTGVVTFKNAKELKEVAKQIPLDKLLIETDSPYLAPEPFRGKSNQPQYVRYVAEHIAEIRQISYNEVVEATSQNAIKLFGLK
ncbi:MAG: TatD family hydrolase [Candidatus Buchananbacteria bacterium]|nr:TatD family hydrolase [Candidatus Buchananbacteria bacterium]